MKTRELVRRLQEEDPTGELEAVVGNEDIYFIEEQEAYWDGTPALLLHDPKKRDRCWSICGLRVMASNERKIQIHTVSVANALLGHPDLPVTYSDDDACRYNEERVEAVRAECKQVIAKVDAEMGPRRSE